MRGYKVAVAANLKGVTASAFKLGSGMVLAFHPTCWQILTMRSPGMALATFGCFTIVRVGRVA